MTDMTTITDPTVIGTGGGGLGLGALIYHLMHRWLSSRPGSTSASGPPSDPDSPPVSAAKVEALEAEVQKLKTDLSLLTVKVEAVQTTMTELRTMIQGVDTGMRGLKTTLDRMTGYMQAMKEISGGRVGAGGAQGLDLSTP